MPQPLITTARTPRHGLPYLFAGQAQKEAFVNEALARLDALVQLTVIGERGDPPADPAPGDCYIVSADPAGAWLGEARAVATWAESQWLFAPAAAGMRAFDLESGCLAVFDPTTGWRRVTAPAAASGGAVQDSEVRAALAAVLDGLRVMGIFA